MAVSTSALTLAQYAILSNDPRILRITYSLLQNAQVLQDIPLTVKKTLYINGSRWTGNLPTVNWARLNTEPTVTTGTPSPYQEQLYFVRNAIDTDRVFVEDENRITDPRAAMIEAYLAAYGYDLNDKFINNDHLAGDAQAPVGLRYRTSSAGQTAYGTNSDMLIDASGMDLTQANMTAAIANNLIEIVQQLLDRMGTREGEGVTIYANDTWIRRFERAVRIAGVGAGFSIVKDAFDRPVANYKQAKIRDIGRKANQTTKIITDTETSAGAAGSSTYTSMYAVRYGEGQFHGWQFDEFMMKDIGRIGNAGTILRNLADWGVGFIQDHTRCVGRIFGFKVS